LRDIKEFGKEVGREPFLRSWQGRYEKSPGVWETKTFYDNSKIAPQYLALRNYKGTKRLNQIVDGNKVDSFDDADVALMPVYKKPTTPIELIDNRQPYSPIQTNPNNAVQLPINNIPLQQMPTIGTSSPSLEGNNAYWKKQDNQLIRQNNEYSNNMNLDISPELGDRFHQEPSWMVGEDKYYERDGKAYMVPQPNGGWKNKQNLDASSGKWKSKIVKKANGGWLDQYPEGGPLKKSESGVASYMLNKKDKKFSLGKNKSLKEAYRLKNNGDFNPNMYHDMANIIESGDYGLDVLGNTISDQVIPGKIINFTTQTQENTKSEWVNGANMGLELLKNTAPFYGDLSINALQKGITYLGNKNPEGIDRTYNNYFKNEKGAKYSNGGWLDNL